MLQICMGDSLYYKFNDSIKKIEITKIEYRVDKQDIRLTCQDEDNYYLLDLLSDFGRVFFATNQDAIDNIKYKIISYKTDEQKILYEYIDKDNKSIVVQTVTPNATEFDILKDNIRLRNVKHLYHFTRIENLESILKNGLVPKKYLKDNNESFIENDFERKDNHCECNCLSLKYPNTRYLNRRRNSDNVFVIIEYGIDLLIKAFEMDCVYFSDYNAARSDAYCRKGIVSFINMFKESYFVMNPIKYELDYGVPSKKTNRLINLSLNYPSHDQAEILINAVIGKNYITRIVFHNDEDLKKCEHYLKDYDITYIVDPDYYLNRNEYIVKKLVKNG